MSVKSIFKTLDTLDYFLKSDSTKGVSLKEICDRLGFKKSAAHHMLSSICDNAETTEVGIMIANEVPIAICIIKLSS